MPDGVIVRKIHKGPHDLDQSSIHQTGSQLAPYTLRNTIVLFLLYYILPIQVNMQQLLQIDNSRLENKSVIPRGALPERGAFKEKTRFSIYQKSFISTLRSVIKVKRKTVKKKTKTNICKLFIPYLALKNFQWKFMYFLYK